MLLLVPLLLLLLMLLEWLSPALARYHFRMDEELGVHQEAKGDQNRESKSNIAGLSQRKYTSSQQGRQWCSNEAEEETQSGEDFL